MKIYFSKSRGREIIDARRTNLMNIDMKHNHLVALAREFGMPEDDVVDMVLYLNEGPYAMSIEDCNNLGFNVRMLLKDFEAKEENKRVSRVET